MPLLHEGGSKGRGLLHPDKLEGVTEGDGFGVADVVFPGGFLMAHFRNGARSHVFDFRTYFVVTFAHTSLIIAISCSVKQLMSASPAASNDTHS